MTLLRAAVAFLCRTLSPPPPLPIACRPQGGEFVTGYLNRSEIADFDFHTLVAGVVWLVRDGVNYVNTSAQLEDMSVQVLFFIIIIPPGCWPPKA